MDKIKQMLKSYSVSSRVLVVGTEKETSIEASILSVNDDDSITVVDWFDTKERKIPIKDITYIRFMHDYRSRAKNVKKLTIKLVDRKGGVNGKKV